LRFERATMNISSRLHGSTGRPLRDGNLGALKAARRTQYTSRPSEPQVIRRVRGQWAPAIPHQPLRRVKLLCQFWELSLRARSPAIAAHRVDIASQAAIPVRYCFPHLALADARHSQPPAPLSPANLSFGSAGAAVRELLCEHRSFVEATAALHVK
jgi:hypothetical protein